MIVVRSPNNYNVSDSSPKVFLAGCANTEWRKNFVNQFYDYRVVFLDPKRDDWNNMGQIEKINQITWEFSNLRECDIIIYHFNAGSVCPITLLEYGMWGLSTGRPIVVYIEDNYEKKQDIIFQTLLARPDVIINKTFEELIEQLKTILVTWKQKSN
jgi:hypothetical protein